MDSFSTSWYKANYLGILKIKSNGTIISELIDEIPEPENKTGKSIKK